MTLDDRLRIAETEISRLRALIAERDPYPVGTVLQGHGYGGNLAFAHRLARIHPDVAGYQRPQSDTPVWTVVWSDFSGGICASFNELRTRYAHIDWQQIYFPGREIS